MAERLAGEGEMIERDLQGILAEGFGTGGKLTPLPGEHDRNFRLDADDGATYLFKLHSTKTSTEMVDMQVAVLAHLERYAPELPVSRQLKTRAGTYLHPLPDGALWSARLLNWLQGDVWAKAKQREGHSAASLGRMLGRLDAALVSFSHAQAARPYDWDIGRAQQHLDTARLIGKGQKHDTVVALLEHFKASVLPKLATCPRQVIHNDANDYNVLLDAQGNVSGLLDFGDMVETYRIVELAVASAYALIGADDPVGAILPLIAAYHEVNPITPEEADVLFELIKVRLAVSICMAARQIRETPDNKYLLISQNDVWRELKRLALENGRLQTLRIRDACGFPAVEKAARIVKWLEAQAHHFAPVIKGQTPATRFALLDFSRTSSDAHKVLKMSPAQFELHCARALKAAGAHYGIGRYGEDRNVYRTKAFATTSAKVRRSVHLGIDVFAPAGTPVCAPLAGEVAFLHDDDVSHGFGPTVLLAHHTPGGDAFWTLYGHLARADFRKLKIGQSIARGQAFARYGARKENGNWAPHLHFQIVTDHLGLGARMHGVGVGRDWQIWREISPDPNVIMGIPVATSAVVARDPQWLVAQRHRRIGRSLSIAYAPSSLKITGGEGAYLIDDQGQRWLDMVNNVCHVGHCHPRVVEAAHKQMALLNTNSRYLHDTLVEYADRLVALFPDELSVCFFVNSGSEANDLALRLAKAYTRQSGLLTVDHAYHGHVTSLIDVSPYKFNGRGGEGRPPHVRVAELPDPYRGRYRHGDAAAGEKYADDVARQISALAGDGLKPALFFSEGILGTGGQVMPPAGYLKQAYAHVRAAGGLCLADEVQVGFGRVGKHMWAFELQGVAPDIVTMGKPIGNGHPMAAVVTRPEIAAAFANGMEYFNTFGGNPVSAAIGLEVLNVIRDERLRHNCDVVGDRLMSGARRLAKKHQLIGDVRGSGLFNGIELVHDRETLQPAADAVDFVIAEMKQKHHILLSSEGPHHNVLKIKPPAVFTASNCDFFLDALDDVFNRVRNIAG